MNDKKLITIVVPCYNGEEWICDCINSLKNQTYSHFEVFIFNNKSTDNSLKLMNECTKNDVRFKVINSPKQLSAGESRNEALKLAEGEYITYLDCDDTFEPDYLESMLAKGDSDYIVCDWNKVYPNNKKEDRIIPLEKEFLDKKDLLNLQKRIIGEEHPNSPLTLDIFSSIAGKFFKTKIIKENNILFTSSNQLGGADDALFNIEYLEFCNTGIKINKKLYNYLCNPKSFTHKTQNLNKIDKFVLQYQKFNDFINKYNKPESYLNALNSRIYIQTFGAFIIAQSSNSSKNERISKLNDYINTDIISSSLEKIKPKDFSFVFAPFFKAIKRKRIKFCYFYIKLALIYRNRNF